MGKDLHKGVVPSKTHLCPFPTTKEILELTRCPNFLIAFHRPTAYPSLTPANTTHHVTPHICPLITWFQKASFSFAKCQLHLPRRALSSRARLFTPNLPFLLSRQTVVDLTKWGFLSRAPPPHIKSLWICPTLISLILYGVLECVLKLFCGNDLIFYS